ncbi:MAG: deoxyribonuclease IV [Actinobacteria bacterium]|nr:deoxyribonuclease IV [Actinomycetota bacterium]
MRIGAHVPTRGGLSSAIDAARECRAEAVQVFLSNPRSWAAPRVSEREAEEFRAAWRQSGLGPLFAHAPYLVNIASPNPEFLRKSVDLARRSIAAASAVGAAGFVVHAGSGGPDAPALAFERAVAALRAVAPEDDTAVVIELTAGTAGSIAATFPEAARLFDAIGDDRLRLCADTCHLFAAGYGLDEPEGVAACFEELRAVGLAERLALIHANDAKFGRGSHRDRHQHIGEGRIGRAGFAAILARPEVRDLATVVETPGDLADHARNIATLRSLAE